MRLRAIWIDRLTISELEGILSRQSKKHLSSSDDLLFLLKHPPSFSYHKEADLKHIKSSLSYPLIKAERGGGVMYHDEGQLVLAPVVKLREGFGVPEYVYALEETMIRALNELFSIKGFRIRWSKDGYSPGSRVYGYMRVGDLPKSAFSDVNLKEALYQGGVPLI